MELNNLIIILSSYLMGILPIVFLWVNNVSHVPALQIVKILSIFSVCFALIYTIASYFFNLIDISLVIIGLSYLVFFGKIILQNKKLLIINLVVIFGYISLFFLSTDSIFLILKYFLVLELFISIVFTFHLIKYFHTIKNFRNNSNRSDAEVVCKRPYNVYFIIPDGYESFETLEKIGINNNEFKESLKKEGFFVFDKPHSNYNLTQNSICSTLNMDYIHNFFIPKENIDIQSNRTLLFSYIFNHKVGNTFKKLGYKYYHILNNWEKQNLKFNDIADKQIDIMNSLEFETAIFCQTFMEQKVNKMQSKFMRLVHLKILSEIINVSKDPDLKFVYSHILCPHPPFCFDENGNLPDSFFNVVGTYFGKGESSEDFIKMYSGQIKFLNKKILEVIENIKKNDPKSIIIIQADHGCSYHLYKNKELKDKPNKEFLQAKFSPLRAIYAPDDFNFDFDSSVNLFRAVFNYICDKNDPLIEDKYFYSKHENYFIYKEISKFFFK